MLADLILQLPLLSRQAFRGAADPSDFFHRPIAGEVFGDFHRRKRCVNVLRQIVKLIAMLGEHHL